jgi:hypothetical protein
MLVHPSRSPSLEERFGSLRRYLLVLGLVVVPEQHAPQQLPHLQAIGHPPSLSRSSD